MKNKRADKNTSLPNIERLQNNCFRNVWITLKSDHYCNARDFSKMGT